MPYGYTGNILNLDLSTKKYWIEHPKERFYYTYWVDLTSTFYCAEHFIVSLSSFSVISINLWFNL